MSAEGSRGDERGGEGYGFDRRSETAFGDRLEAGSMQGNANNGDPFAPASAPKPELAVAAAFAGGFLLALVLRRIRS